MKYPTAILLCLFCVTAFSQTENRSARPDTLNLSAEINDTCTIHLSWYVPYTQEFQAWLDTTDIIIDTRPYVDCEKDDCTLVIKPVCPCTDFQVTYFNRWGEILYQGDHVENAWYAYDQPDGVYIWQLKGTYETGQQFKHHGHVTLLH